MNALMLWDNPLVIRSIRTRLCLPLMLSWALVTIVASAFLYIIVYGNAVKDEGTTAAEASREAILPLLIMQGIILMVLGTGAVAGGIARERTYRLLDYQRLTPMSPTAKIIGMLVGLPIREYFMFAISLPFVFYAAWKGGLSFGVLLNFYVVFFSSTLVYHMTGLAAGMVVGKPWQAGTVSQGLVVVLYLMLPNISYLGFTFFEFLTARPVFYGLVNIHLLPDGLMQNLMQGEFNQAIGQGIDQALDQGLDQAFDQAKGLGVEQINMTRYKTVDFFGTRLSPVFFSLAVQAYALVSLYVIVYRKWQSEARLPFSKGYALLFFAIAQLFLVGSVQPFLANDHLFDRLARTYRSVDNVGDPRRTIVLVIFILNITVSGCASILTVYLCTPNRHQSLAGIRRALRQGRSRLGWNNDAASGLPIAVACTLMSWLGFIAVYQSAAGAGRVGVVNTPLEFVMPMVLFAVVLLTVQQVIEQFSERIFVMKLFVFWLVPILAFLIIATAVGRPVTGLYAGLTFPLFAIVFACALLMSDPDNPLPRDLQFTLVQEHMLPITMLTIAIYFAAASVLLWRAWRRWRWMREQAGALPDPEPAPEPRVKGHAEQSAPVPIAVKE